MPGASAHCCGMARFINRPHVATFMFIWPGRKKFLPTKIVSMIRKYHNYKLQTNPWHREEEPHNNHETPKKKKKKNSMSYYIFSQV